MFLLMCNVGDATGDLSESPRRTPAALTLIQTLGFVM